MTLEHLLGFVLAGFAAGGNALANVMQRKAGREGSAGQPFGLGVMLELVRSSTWLLGFLGMVASFVLQAVALGMSELSAIEPVITLEVPLTLLIASRVFRVRLGRAEWTGILVMTAGMIALVATLNPQSGNAIAVSDTTYLQAGGGTALTIVALLLLGRRGRPVVRTAFQGAAAGTSFGLTATLLKGVMTELSDRGVSGVLTSWQTYAGIGFGVLGVLVMQSALHLGPLIAAQPGFTLMDPVVSILWGVLVYNETTRSGGWLVLATASAIAVGVGVRVLAGSPLLDGANQDPGRIALPGTPSGGSVLG